MMRTKEKEGIDHEPDECGKSVCPFEGRQPQIHILFVQSVKYFQRNPD
jgi:hypothetical protein